MDQSLPKEDRLCEKEQQTFRRKAARLQFMQSLFHGIGGALLFGLISSLVLGGGAVAATLPIWALFVIPVISVASMFIGTRCGIESQLLSQQLGAKMMGKAVKPSMAAEAAPEQPKSLPPGMEEAPDRNEDEEKTADSGKPGHRVHGAAALERVESPAQSVAVH